MYLSNVATRYKLSCTSIENALSHLFKIDSKATAQCHMFNRAKRSTIFAPRSFNNVLSQPGIVDWKHIFPNLDDGHWYYKKSKFICIDDDDDGDGEDQVNTMYLMPSTPISCYNQLKKIDRINPSPNDMAAIDNCNRRLRDFKWYNVIDYDVRNMVDAVRTQDKNITSTFFFIYNISNTHWVLLIRNTEWRVPRSTKTDDKFTLEHLFRKWFVIDSLSMNTQTSPSSLLHTTHHCNMEMKQFIEAFEMDHYKHMKEEESIRRIQKNNFQDNGRGADIYNNCSHSIQTLCLIKQQRGWDCGWCLLAIIDFIVKRFNSFQIRNIDKYKNEIPVLSHSLDYNLIYSMIEQCII